MDKRIWGGRHCLKYAVEDKAPEKTPRLPTGLENEEVRLSSASVTTVHIHPTTDRSGTKSNYDHKPRASALGTGHVQDHDAAGALAESGTDSLGT